MYSVDVPKGLTEGQQFNAELGGTTMLVTALVALLCLFLARLHHNGGPAAASLSVAVGAGRAAAVRAAAHPVAAAAARAPAAAAAQVARAAP